MSKINISDVVDCLEISFDIRKILLEAIGLILSILILLAFFFIGNIANNGFISFVSYLIGFILSIFSFGITSVAISKMAYSELSIGEKLNWKEAISFSFKNWTKILLSPIIVLLIVAIFYFVQKLFFLLGNIPALAVIISIFTVPIVILNALLILFLALSTTFIPAIISVDNLSPIKIITRIYEILKTSTIKTYSYIALLSLIGGQVLLSGAIILYLATFIPFLIFSSSTGIFSAIYATELETFPVSISFAWVIFVLSILIILLAFISYSIVFLKTSLVNFYHSIKGNLK